MPQTKKTKSGASGTGAKRGAQTAKKSNTTPKKQQTNQRAEIAEDRLTPAEASVPYILAIIALFLLVSMLTSNITGTLGVIIKSIFFGMFAGGGFLIPVLLCIYAFYWKKNVFAGTKVSQAVYELLLLLFFSAMLHIWTGGADTFKLAELFKDGINIKGGGAIGGLICELMLKCVGIAGTYILGIAAIIVFGVMSFGLTPYSVGLYIAYHIHEAKEEKHRQAETDRVGAAQREKCKNKPKPEPYIDEDDDSYDPYTSRRKRGFNPDVPVDEADPSQNGSDDVDDAYVDPDDLDDADDEGYEEAPEDDASEILPDGVTVEYVKPINKTKRKGVGFEGEAGVGIDPDKLPDEKERIDLSSIFTDNDGVDVLQKFADSRMEENLEKQKHLMQEEEEAELELKRAAAIESSDDKKKEYVFPPLSLLNIDTSPKNEDISEELHTNAARLVETLNSFKVRTHIVNVSRGPTITRYELVPEEGVRVRAIANLVDDISLNLARSGVRIEAPIPGKAAVGVEVPNKSVSTVYLRELIDTNTFRSASSRTTAVLGMDVAGNPVFLDICKMPHLLIAGATGMGKSVCINSLIASLLYKAKPEEVKFILIDPKKVEFNIYNGLPHLLVPVVSDPKKAAGALHWAVTEMERRYTLIEEAGVRDIKAYNNVTKDDPEKEYLPQIIIIIDELADLMMTSPDDVEASICRIAQKARAAGMHLILGTQRPSVNVITGTIKANIPSRIAFTVASQTDSRVVLDMAGAEKLIGRGDMLYAPVGAMKPQRVQGAFVSEKEVMAIVDFIKRQSVAEYDQSVIDDIEREAEKCEHSGKKGALGGGFDDSDSDSGGDPMFRQALELAVESGKISTSLIQRRLSLGYGRAAKIIDEMESRGYVSAPEGQKPRNVLITREQFMEMVLDRNENI